MGEFMASKALTRPLRYAAVLTMLASCGVASAADYFAHEGALLCVAKDGDGNTGIVTLTRFTDGCAAGSSQACFQAVIKAKEGSDTTSLSLPLMCEQYDGAMTCAGSMFGSMAFAMALNASGDFNGATIFAPMVADDEAEVFPAMGNCFI